MEGETIRLNPSVTNLPDDATLSDIEHARQGLRNDLVVTALSAFTIGPERGCPECRLGLEEAGTIRAFRQYRELLNAYGVFLLGMRALDKAEDTNREQPETIVMGLWRNRRGDND